MLLSGMMSSLSEKIEYHRNSVFKFQTRIKLKVVVVSLVSSTSFIRTSRREIPNRSLGIEAFPIHCIGIRSPKLQAICGKHNFSCFLYRSFSFISSKAITDSIQNVPCCIGFYQRVHHHG